MDSNSVPVLPGQITIFDILRSGDGFTEKTNKGASVSQKIQVLDHSEVKPRIFFVRRTKGKRTGSQS